MRCGVEPRGASTFVGFVVQASFEFVIILLPQLPVLEIMCVCYHTLLINSFILVSPVTGLLYMP